LRRYNLAAAAAFIVDQRTRAKDLEAAARARAASERARQGLADIARHVVESTRI